MNERSNLLGETPNDGFWQRRSALEKALIFLASLALLGAIVAAIVYTTTTRVTPAPNNRTTTTTTTTTTTLSPTDAPTGTPITTSTTTFRPTTPPVISICQTQMCKNEASRIRQTIDTSAEPCDDFYQYSCGGYFKNHSLPGDKGKFGMFQAVEENVRRRLRDIYSQDYLPTEIPALTYIRHFYQGCNDTDTLDSRQVDPLVDILQRVQGWPLAGNATGYSNYTYSWQEALEEIAGHFYDRKNSILLDISVAADSKNTSRNIIYLDSPKLGVGREDLLNYHGNDTRATKVVDAYKSFIRDTAALFKSNVIGSDEMIRELVEFEIQLARFITPPQERKNMEQFYHKFTWHELSMDLFEMDWYSFISRLYSRIGSKVTIRPTDEVAVVDLEYLRKMSKYIYSMAGNTTTVANYLGWRLLQEKGFMTSDQFRDNEFDFLKVQLGLKEKIPMWKRCLDTLIQETPTLVGRAYVDNWFTEADAYKSRRMVEFVRSSYKNILDEKDWLDQGTRERALAKLNKMTVNVGYPLWIKDDVRLQAEYRFNELVDRQDPFSAWMYLEAFMNRKMFDKYKTPVDLTKEWPQSAPIVNAAYEPTQNSITIPAGILQLIFFNETRPSYLNFGSMGAIVGHELSHGFDEQGSQYDLNGTLNNWWTNNTRLEFVKRARCFVEQYGSIVDDQVDLPLNGENTLNENIADNGGLHAAYEAYHLRVRDPVEDALLPGFKNWTADQLFFTSFAQTWCTMITDEKLRQDILYDVHSPSKYRVMMSLANFEPFTQAFQCKVGSDRMSPANRCTLW